MWKKYPEKCGERMDSPHQPDILKQKKNGYDLTNQYPIKSQLIILGYSSESCY
jgi:hypothetical protein